MLCNEAPLVKEIPQGVALRRLECRSWNCDYCRKRRKRGVIREAIAGDPTTLVTLTVHADSFGADPSRQARELVIAWRKYVRIWQRQNKQKLPYFAVFEATQNGHPHLHILARAQWIDQRELSLHMDLEIGAPIVDVRRCNNRKKAARYVSKYIGKSPGKFGTCKRYWQTRCWADKPPRRRRSCGHGWNFHNRYPGSLWDAHLHYTVVLGWHHYQSETVHYYTKQKKKAQLQGPEP